jgi:hypothetical protein
MNLNLEEQRETVVMKSDLKRKKELEHLDRDRLENVKKEV